MAGRSRFAPVLGRGRALGLTPVLGLAALGSAVLGVGAATNASADPGFTTSQAATLTNLACEKDHQVCWSAAKDANEVLALGQDGSLKGKLSYAGSPVDVEAIAYHDAHLYVGDIGDPKASRTSIVVRRLGSFTYGSTVTPRSYLFAYPDHPQDAAAMMVSPRGRIYLVTRGATPGIYRSSITPVSDGSVNKLVRVADAPANVTDATFSADGAHMVLRTVNAVHVLDPYSFEETASAALPATAQGDAVSASLTGTALLVSGQGNPVPVSSVAMPTTLATLPSSPATPSAAEASPSAAASTAAEAAKQATSPSNRGTWWALGAAALISLAAAVVVVVKR